MGDMFDCAAVQWVNSASDFSEDWTNASPTQQTNIQLQAGRRLDSTPSANVVAMATRVSHTRFCMVALNRPKIP